MAIAKERLCFNVKHITMTFQKTFDSGNNKLISTEINARSIASPLTTGLNDVLTYNVRKCIMSTVDYCR